MSERGSVETYYKSGDTDDTASFQRALDKHECVTVPWRSYPYEITGRSRNAQGEWYGVLIPSGRTLTRGPWLKPRIRLRVADTRSVEGAVHDWFDPNNIAHFLIEKDAVGVTIDGLVLQGEGPKLDRSNWVVNVQASAIRDVNGRGTSVRRCSFSSLFGFAFHQPGGGRNLEYSENAHRDCMNGVNPNCDGVLAYKNRFLRAEGFEGSGSDSWYLDNTLEQVISAFSIGGDMGSGPQALHRNVVVRRNTVDGVWWLDQQSGPVGAISVADNIEDVTVSENTVRHAEGVAIHVHKQYEDKPVRNVRVVNNTLAATGIREFKGRANFWSRYPIFVEHADDVQVNGNTITDSEPEYGAKAGVFARMCKRVSVGENDISVEGPSVSLVGCT